MDPEIEHSTATFCLLLPQCIRHYPRQPSESTGDNPAGRTGNRIKKNRAQNPNVHDMSSQPQTQKPGTLTRVGPPAPSVKLVRRALALPTTSRSASSSLSFLPLTASERNSPRGDRREEDDVNIGDHTIRGALPAGSVRLSHRESERVQSGHGSEPDPEVDANL